MDDKRIAVVGMACRFPRARTPREFWKNLWDGVDAVRRFSREELMAHGVPAEIAGNERYIGASGYLDDADRFDAKFFGYSPAEAQLVDPQQRLFLEVCWHAFEDAGYDPHCTGLKTGVYAGCAPNKYFLYHVFRQDIPSLDRHNWDADDLPPGTNPDALSTRVAYKLGLDGPALTVLTACSSSLVAIALACDALVARHCDMAVAGGAAIQLPHQTGYFSDEAGGMLSKGGQCRPFDRDADGSVFGSGVGAVVLRRLDDAVANGDMIYAVLKGWAVRNDGANRAGYSAPSVDGQANTISAALRMAEIAPCDIGYVEAHGSATPVGDPIEFEALRVAFAQCGPTVQNSCALGSVKGNVGHLDAAAGIAGLIKTVLAVHYGKLPCSLHFIEPNDDVDLANSPFHIQRQSADWSPMDGRLRRAGVSSFGLGGTNAHVIVEEYRSAEAAVSAQWTEAILPISGKTPEALEARLSILGREVGEHPAKLAEMAWTLATGRAHFEHRAVVAASDDGRSRVLIKARTSGAMTNVAFMLPGVGNQRENALRSLYDEDGTFRSTISYISNGFRSYLDADLDELLFTRQPVDSWRPAQASHAASDPMAALHQPAVELTQLQRTRWAQPACFAFEYALAVQLIEWGVRPSSLIGHSIGEFVAAALSGAISVDDAIRLVAIRALAIEKLPRGAMIAVPLGTNDINPYLGEGVALSASNSDALSILAGTEQQIEWTRQRLASHNVLAQWLPVEHAYHSHLLRDAAAELDIAARSVRVRAPSIPYISNVTGKWITDQQLNDPGYWGQHLCSTVRFAAGMRTLLETTRVGLLVEVGHGQTLSGYTQTLLRPTDLNVRIESTDRQPAGGDTPSGPQPAAMLGRLWVAGASVDWKQVLGTGDVRRISLAGYPFEPARHWLSRPRTGSRLAVGENRLSARWNSAGQQIPEIQASRDFDSGADSILVTQSSIHERPDLRTPYAAPTNEIEQIIADLWCNLFGFDQIGIHDDFVELGGHSLLALQFANKLWRARRVEMPLVALLNHSTVAQLADFLADRFDAARGAVTGTQTCDLAPSDGKVEFDVVTRYVQDSLRRCLGKEMLLDDTFADGDMSRFLPELLVAMRRDFDIRLYPNEVAGFSTPGAVCDYLLGEITRHRAVSETRRVVTWGDTGVVQQSSLEIAFVLSSVRSGSTLLRVMLAGHSALFSPPELHLLRHENMDERDREDRSPDKNQGLVRALVEVLDIEPAHADAMIAGMVASKMPTSEVLARLAQRLEGRLLVDKSPGYSNDIEVLRKTLRDFPKAKYLYLTRHPCAVVESMVRNRFVRLMEGGNTDPFDFGEFAWVRSNGNILDFSAEVPPERFMHVRYEDLMADTRGKMESICHFLRIQFEDALLKPYSGARMRDGLGDPNFFEHDRIEPGFVDKWRQANRIIRLGPASRYLADRLGYQS
ncbi:beta-ketoacyl synthase N-terminal-like domain-containing protein [Trinickia sp. NRRL B-1857]|uniref:beta-ketoacyl synthase N-terminal-like domain-containing protein n=1 Tax=Trinickia sp. NRRL B-1857 TaxID=3162879 RepID=UPI003D2E0CCA